MTQFFLVYFTGTVQRDGRAGALPVTTLSTPARPAMETLPLDAAWQVRPPETPGNSSTSIDLNASLLSATSTPEAVFVRDPGQQAACELQELHTQLLQARRELAQERQAREVAESCTRALMDDSMLLRKRMEDRIQELEQSRAAAETELKETRRCSAADVLELCKKMAGSRNETVPHGLNDKGIHSDSEAEHNRDLSQPAAAQCVLCFAQSQAHAVEVTLMHQRLEEAIVQQNYLIEEIVRMAALREVAESELSKVQDKYSKLTALHQGLTPKTPPGSPHGRTPPRVCHHMD